MTDRPTEIRALHEKEKNAVTGSPHKAGLRAILLRDHLPWLLDQLADRDAAIAKAMAILKPGSLVDAHGKEIPTTLVERAQYVVMALESEADIATEAGQTIKALRVENARLLGALTQAIASEDALAAECGRIMEFEDAHQHGYTAMVLRAALRREE